MSKITRFLCKFFTLKFSVVLIFWQISSLGKWSWKIWTHVAKVWQNIFQYILIYLTKNWLARVGYKLHQKQKLYLGSAWGGSRRRKEYHPLLPMTNCWSSNEAILLDLSLTIAWSLLFLHTDLCTRMQVCECVCVRAYLRRVFGCAVYIPACVHTKWPPSNNRGPLQSVFLSRKSLRNCL